MDLYFDLWLHVLDVDYEDYDQLCTSIYLAGYLG